MTLPMGFLMKEMVLLTVSLYLLTQDLQRFASTESAEDLSEVAAVARGRG
jgi:hypothetical protein